MDRAWRPMAALQRQAQVMCARAYASSARSAKVTRHFAYQDRRTKLSDRKTYLYGMYERLMKESELLLLFETENVSMPLMNAVRAQIAHVPIPTTDHERLVALNGGQPWDRPASRFSVVRTGLLRPVCRKHDSEAIQQLGPYLHGQLALLACPVLSPEYVGRLLRAMEKPLRAAAAAVDPKSGKKVPKIAPLVAVVEHTRLIEAQGLPALTKLPDLATLRAQIVGLVSAPGQQLAGVLSQARGGLLAATLDARRRDLEPPSP
ncbi:Uncharacterized protein MSYG_3984 [Malassezia sympodialis ATCC 42132]|uniref:Uncharacterized protein n=1 Tax=Malassezia sympodialis (strain ATCC 42132) TaxID=1230383 RepID=A0A1M8ABA8_MALS4|nr:Uncharacterized protein MSYG_3984 [Malassezia sympodialis ATCC 42132]